MTNRGLCFVISLGVFLCCLATIFLLWMELFYYNHEEIYHEHYGKLADFGALLDKRNIKNQLHDIQRARMEAETRVKRNVQNSDKESDSLVNVLRILDLKLDSKPRTSELKKSNQSQHTKLERLGKENGKLLVKDLKEVASNTVGLTKRRKAYQEAHRNRSNEALIPGNSTRELNVTIGDNTTQLRRKSFQEQEEAKQVVLARSASELELESEKGMKGIEEGASQPEIVIEIERMNKTEAFDNESAVYDTEKNLEVKVHVNIQGQENLFEYTILLADEPSSINIDLNGSTIQKTKNFNLCELNKKNNRTGEKKGEVRPEVFLPPSRIRGTIGEEMKIDCNATGDPVPVLNWQKVTLKPAQQQQHVIHGNHSLALVLRNASTADSGVYICAAENTVGKDWKMVKLDFVQKDCSAWLELGYHENGVYTINPDGGSPFDVYCDMKTSNRGWIVIQRRVDGTVDFFRSWSEYKNGFGDLNSEFWLGNDRIHELTTKNGYMMLRVDMEDSLGQKAYAEYGQFYVDDEEEKYRLHVKSYNGTAGDSLAYHNGAKFSTRDSNNEVYRLRCAQRFRGAWWFRTCLRSNLNGLYAKGTEVLYGAEGIKWLSFYYKQAMLIKTEMKIAMIKP